MIGVFDSGVGGLTAVAELRRVAPLADICFFADRKNAPYGTKQQKELISLVTEDVKKLRSAGADKILMACCTASSVHRLLPEDIRSIAYPIIAPAAKEAARVTKNGKIAVIATDATVASHAFSSELLKYPTVKEVLEIPLQPLVSMIERGARDRNLCDTDRQLLAEMLSEIGEKGQDTLILGCTHFPHLENEIKSILPKIKTVNPSREGALEIIKYVSGNGSGQTIYM